MPNMGHCRFENTAKDLSDCLDNWDLDEDASDYEIMGKDAIIDMAREIVSRENNN